MDCPKPWIHLNENFPDHFVRGIPDGINHNPIPHLAWGIPHHAAKTCFFPVFMDHSMHLVYCHSMHSKNPGFRQGGKGMPVLQVYICIKLSFARGNSPSLLLGHLDHIPHSDDFEIASGNWFEFSEFIIIPTGIRWPGYIPVGTIIRYEHPIFFQCL